jgi:hypothetical protein
MQWLEWGSGFPSELHLDVATDPALLLPLTLVQKCNSRFLYRTGDAAGMWLKYQLCCKTLLSTCTIAPLFKFIYLLIYLFILMEMYSQHKSNGLKMYN